MPRVVNTALASRRAITLAAIGALLAALVLMHAPAPSRPVANRTILPVLTPCLSAEVAFDQAQPMLPITSVNITASSTNCASPMYRFAVLAPGTSTWVFKTAYTSSATYHWNTVGAQVGVWQVSVWARDVQSAAKYQAYAIRTFNIGYQFCSGSLLNASPLSPQIGGTSVSLMGYAQDCPFPTFAFWKLAPGSTTWVLVAPYNQATQGVTSHTYTWDTTGAAPGAWRWSVWVREGSSPHRYDTYAMLTYWVQ